MAEARSLQIIVGTNEAGRLLGRARQLVQAEATGIVALEPQIDQRLIDLTERVMATRGKILVAGVGASAEVARRMASLLAVTGTPSLSIPPAGALHGRFGPVTSDDVVIAISRGGQSSEVNEFAHRARERGAYVVAITGDGTSGLVEAASVAITIQDRSRC